MTYKIVRIFRDTRRRRYTIKRGLTLEQARTHCQDPETSSRTATSAVARRRTRKLGDWMDTFTAEGN